MRITGILQCTSSPCPADPPAGNSAPASTRHQSAVCREFPITGAHYSDRPISRARPCSLFPIPSPCSHLSGLCPVYTPEKHPPLPPLSRETVKHRNCVTLNPKHLYRSHTYFIPKSISPGATPASSTSPHSAYEKLKMRQFSGVARLQRISENAVGAPKYRHPGQQLYPARAVEPSLRPADRKWNRRKWNRNDQRQQRHYALRRQSSL